MKISTYLKDKGLVIFFIALILIVNSMLLSFLDIAPMVIFVTESLFFTGYTVTLMMDYISKWKYYSQLEESLAHLEEKSYLSELIDPPHFYEGRIVHKILKTEEKYLNDIISGQQTEMMEYYDYAQMWVHEVKTPIAVSKLMIENHKNEITMSLEEEIDKIEFCVEQILYYAKCGTLEKDYKIDKINLRRVIAPVLQKYSKMIIGKGVWPKLMDLDYEVLSDEKWLGFIIGQIVSNAVKYKAEDRNSEILFSARKESRHVTLSICDNGIGIAPSDIEYVFRKGYTGVNGRAFKKSTGMGLYICSQLCTKMGIQIQINSSEGQWTEVTLTLQSA